MRVRSTKATSRATTTCQQIQRADLPRSASSCKSPTSAECTPHPSIIRNSEAARLVIGSNPVRRGSKSFSPIEAVASCGASLEFRHALPQRLQSPLRVFDLLDALACHLKEPLRPATALGGGTARGGGDEAPLLKPVQRGVHDGHGHVP